MASSAVASERNKALAAGQEGGLFLPHGLASFFAPRLRKKDLTCSE